MALIKCPECGREISEFASHCIGCGCPMAKIKQMLASQPSQAQEDLHFKLPHFKTKPDGFLTKLSPEAKKCALGFIEVINYKYMYSFSVAEFKAKLKIVFRTVPQFIAWFALTRASNDLKLCFKTADDVSSKYVLARSKGKYSVEKLLSKIIPLIEDLGIVDTCNEVTTDASVEPKIFNNTRCDVFCYLFKKELDKEFGNKFKLTIRGHYLLFKEKEDEPAVFWFRFKDGLLSFFVRPKNGSKKNMMVIYDNLDEVKLCIDFVRKHLNLPSDKKEPEKTKEVEQPKDKKEEVGALYSDLTNKEKAYIDEFEHILMSNYEGLTSRETKYTYRYRHKGFDRNIFWLTKPGKDLMFKYWENVNSNDETTISIKASDHSPESLAMIARDVLEKVDIHPISRKQLLPINDLIVKALKDNKVSGPDKYVEIAKDVAAYTLNYIFNKYKDLKSFKTREEFDRYKNTHNDYVYHGRGMSLKYPTPDDAEFCFRYYIASRFITIIQKYERVFNETIVVDYKTLLDSYYKLVKNDDDGYSAVSGINSKIANVQYEEFEQERKKYYLK